MLWIVVSYTLLTCIDLHRDLEEWMQLKLTQYVFIALSTYAAYCCFLPAKIVCSFYIF